MENNQPEYINKTIVIFNNKLKDFIKKIKDEIDISVLSLDYSKHAYCEIIFKCQEEIRNYIMKNQDYFDTIDNKKLPKLFNFGEMHSIMVLLLIDDLNNSKYDCFQSIQNELNKIYCTNITTIKNKGRFQATFHPVVIRRTEFVPFRDNQQGVGTC